jgi:phosphonate transport system substrate-binding protein
LPHALAEPGASYSVAIVPQYPAAHIQGEWQPVLDRVAQMAGIRLDMTFHESIPAFENAFLRGESDFIFVNPYHAVMARRAQDYVPLLRDGSALTGILVVRNDSPVVELAQLQGQAIAYPAPNAFGASLYMRALLQNLHHIDTVPNYVTTHGNVYRRVAIGDFAAGGGVNQTLDSLAPELRAELRVLYTTPAVASHPLCAHPRVPAPVQQGVIDAFLALAADAEGRALLQAARLPDPVKADYASDYAPLEALQLEAFVVTETP